MHLHTLTLCVCLEFRQKKRHQFSRTTRNLQSQQNLRAEGVTKKQQSKAHRVASQMRQMYGISTYLHEWLIFLWVYKCR